MLPTDEDVAFYNEHGWYLSKKLLTDDETDELVNAKLTGAPAIRLEKVDGETRAIRE